MNTADCPVAKLDFVNLVASFGGVGSATNPSRRTASSSTPARSPSATR